MSHELRDEVAQAIWDVYRQADRDGPDPSEEAAEEAIMVVLATLRARTEALPTFGLHQGAGTVSKARVLAVIDELTAEIHRGAA